MNPDDFLQLMVEANLALAGFAGVVSVLAPGGVAELRPVQRLRLVNLLATSLLPAIGSLVAMTLLAADVAPEVVWRVLSLMLATGGIFFTARSYRTTLRQQGDQAAMGPSTQTALAAVWSVIYLLLLWNAYAWLAFWPVILGFTCMFSIGCISFARLILSRS